MCWLKRDVWKAGIALAGLLLLLIFLIWVPASSVSATERTSVLAIAGTPTVQVTPTEDATVAALNKEKLQQDIAKDKSDIAKDESDRFWAWTGSGTIIIGIVSAIFTYYQFYRSRLESHDAQAREREDRLAEREKRAEERFQEVVKALGDENVGARVEAAILLRTLFLEQYAYGLLNRQVFRVAVANLRLRHINPNIPEQLDPLSQELITILKESFPLIRSEWEARQNLRSLDASGIQLDSAYLAQSDLSGIQMPNAFLRRADLSGANLNEANLSGASLSEANIEDALSLQGTDLRGAKGLTKEQLVACKAKGAIIDEDAITDSSHVSVSPPASEPSNSMQVPSASPAQVNTPAPSTYGSSAASSQPSAES